MEAKLSARWDCYSSLATLAGLVWERQASPVELTAASLERIERLNSKFNAFKTVTADHAVRSARQAETILEDGQRKPPLLGLPIAIKDFYDTAGIRTTAAFERFKDRVPANDAHAVARLKEAGAVILGKTNMHTLGMGTTGIESFFGPVKNPWNTDFIAGGSSSGSAAAVVSGMCCATLDTDAIGSCRLPAACCGVVGFKGTYSLIDTSGILEGKQPPSRDVLNLAHAGVAARYVEDVAVVLDVLADRSRNRRSASFTESLNQDSELRIGVAADLRLDAEVSEAFDRAVETVRGLDFPTATAKAPLVRFESMADIETDRRIVAERCFGTVDLLLLPTTPSPTPSIQKAVGNPLALSAEHTLFANYFGLPAISVPCGFDKRGLPLGLQIVQPRGATTLFYAWRFAIRRRTRLRRKDRSLERSLEKHDIAKLQRALAA